MIQCNPAPRGTALAAPRAHCALPAAAAQAPVAAAASAAALLAACWRLATTLMGTVVPARGRVPARHHPGRRRGGGQDVSRASIALGTLLRHGCPEAQHVTGSLVAPSSFCCWLLIPCGTQLLLLLASQSLVAPHSCCCWLLHPLWHPGCTQAAQVGSTAAACCPGTHQTGRPPRAG